MSVYPATHEPWSAQRAQAVIAEHARLEGATLPVLHALQEAFGHVPAEAVPLIADALNLSRAEVHGCVTFYHDFRRTAPGRHVLKLCRAEACQATGSVAVHEEIMRRLGVEWHGTTSDGRVTVEPVYCLGLCACGPAALVDGEPVARLTADAAEAMLVEVRQ